MSALHTTLINNTFFITSQDSWASLWQGCIYTLVSILSRFTLRCHGRRARLSTRATTPFLRYIWVVRWNHYGRITSNIVSSVGRNLRQIRIKKNRKTQKDESADQRSAGQEQVARQPRLPTRQTYQKTPRLVSTRRAPLQQNE